jgi:hypothetical protein
MTGECGIRLKEESRFGFQIPDPGTLILLMPCVPLKRPLAVFAKAPSLLSPSSFSERSVICDSESRFGFQIPDPGTLILLMPCVPLKRSLLKLCIQQLRDTRWLSESHITERSENELGALALSWSLSNYSPAASSSCSS